MSQKSAGILLYKFDKGRLKVFLVHPSGPFWAKKDLGVWSIPKGLIENNENTWHAALREFKEETGFEIKPRQPIALTPVKLKSGKIIYAWAIQGDVNPLKLKSNTFDIEWPPHSGIIQSFPEIDKAAWFDIETAKTKINSQQAHFIDELIENLKLTNN